MKTVRCHYCNVGQTRYVGIGRSLCTDCDSSPVVACRGCLALGRTTHSDPRPTPGFTPLEAWV